MKKHGAKDEAVKKEFDSGFKGDKSVSGRSLGEFNSEQGKNTYFNAPSGVIDTGNGSSEHSNNFVDFSNGAVGEKSEQFYANGSYCPSGDGHANPSHSLAFVGQVQPGAYAGQLQPDVYAGQGQTGAYVGQGQADVYLGQVQPTVYPGQAQTSVYAGQGALNGYKSKKRRSKYFWPLAVLMILAILALLFSIGWFYVFGKARTSFKASDKTDLGDLKSNNVSDRDDGGLPTVPYDKDLTNILLIGVDNRKDDNNYNTNSDTMMVLTLDQRNHLIKLTSIQRDMLVKIPGKAGFHKLNSAMFGGPETLLKTLNYNLKLDLNQYIIINLRGAERIVDIMGGVDIDIPNDKALLKYLNSVIWDTNKELGGEWVAPVEKSGHQLLNGRQAICYARLRKLDSDFVRMSRQHEVLKSLMRRFMDVNPFKKLQVIRESMGLITTNLSQTELIGIGTSAVSKIKNPPETLKVPMEGYLEERYINGISYVVPNLAGMIEPLHKFIYGEVHGGNYVIEEYRNASPSYPAVSANSRNTSDRDDDNSDDKSDDERNGRLAPAENSDRRSSSSNTGRRESDSDNSAAVNDKDSDNANKKFDRLTRQNSGNGTGGGSSGNSDANDSGSGHSAIDPHNFFNP